jgi:DDE superfamily endonuclease
VVLLYLPPYSPDFNPIEEMFRELKTYIRQVWDEHIGFVRADFLGFLEECVTVVVPERQVLEAISVVLVS